MAGNTGKMTREAIERRGPRMVLAAYGKEGYFIYREDRPCLPPGTLRCPIARSYTKSYLVNIVKAYRMMP